MEIPEFATGSAGECVFERNLRWRVVVGFAIEEIASIPNVSVFARAEETTSGEHLGCVLIFDCDIGVELEIDRGEAVVAFAVSVATRIGSRAERGNGGGRRLGDGVLEIVDEVAPNLVDGFDGVALAIDRDDFVSNESNSDE